MVQKNRVDFKPAIIIGGTTAVGKSSIAIKLAKDFNGEIISADSMQIYKGFNVGTAKLSKSEMQGITHHLIDIKNGNEQYSVAQFKTDAEKLIDEISNRKKLPIIVGGTGLYLNSLLFNYQFGGKGSYLKAKPAYDYLAFIIEDDRQIVYEKINRRVDKMISDGLIEEIKTLLNSGLNFDMPAFRAIGYKEFRPYFESGANLEACVDALKMNTRHYAKRQITWFKQWKDVAVETAPDYALISEKVKDFLKNENK